MLPAYVVCMFMGFAVLLLGMFMMIKNIGGADDDELTLGKKLVIKGSPGMIVCVFGCIMMALPIWGVSQGTLVTTEAAPYFALEMEDDDSAWWDDDSSY